jgi:hypothetical protein
MNNVSSLIMSQTPTPTAMSQAESWARKSVGVCDRELELNSASFRRGDKTQLSACETTLAVAMFNLASIREMAGDRTTAREFFRKSLDQARTIDMREGIMEAQAALRRLDKADRSSTQKVSPSE